MHASAPLRVQLHTQLLLDASQRPTIYALVFPTMPYLAAGLPNLGMIDHNQSACCAKHAIDMAVGGLSVGTSRPCRKDRFVGLQGPVVVCVPFLLMDTRDDDDDDACGGSSTGKCLCC
jgi:hypothetical protein